MPAHGKASFVFFVDAGLEALGCQDEVCLAVNLPFGGMPGCCPRQLVAVESVGKGLIGGSLRTLGVSMFRCQIFLLSLPSFGMRQDLLWHSNRLELQVYP